MPFEILFEPFMLAAVTGIEFAVHAGTAVENKNKQIKMPKITKYEDLMYHDDHLDFNYVVHNPDKLKQIFKAIKKKYNPEKIRVVDNEGKKQKTILKINDQHDIFGRSLLHWLVLCNQSQTHYELKDSSIFYMKSKNNHSCQHFAMLHDPDFYLQLNEQNRFFSNALNLDHKFLEIAIQYQNSAMLQYLISNCRVYPFMKYDEESLINIFCIINKNNYPSNQLKVYNHLLSLIDNHKCSKRLQDHSNMIKWIFDLIDNDSNLEFISNLNYVTNNKNTIYSLSAQLQLTKRLNQLTQIDQENLINMKNKSGHTPLHYAIKYNASDTVQDLLMLGANPNLKLDWESPVELTSSAVIKRALFIQNLRNYRTTKSQPSDNSCCSFSHGAVNKNKLLAADYLLNFLGDEYIAIEQKQQFDTHIKQIKAALSNGQLGNIYDEMQKHNLSLEFFIIHYRRYIPSAAPSTAMELGLLYLIAYIIKNNQLNMILHDPILMTAGVVAIFILNCFLMLLVDLYEQNNAMNTTPKTALLNNEKEKLSILNNVGLFKPSKTTILKTNNGNTNDMDVSDKTNAVITAFSYNPPSQCEPSQSSP